MRKSIQLLTHIGWLLLALNLQGCKRNQLPHSGTQAHNELHGIVNNGKTANEIILFNDINQFQPKLRFPPEIPVGVETTGWNAPEQPTLIRKGYANDARIGLELTKDLQLVPKKSMEEDQLLGGIGVHFSAHGGRSTPEYAEANFKESIALARPFEDKPELKLREYTLLTANGEISGYLYIPLDKNIKGPGGEKILLGCHVGGASSLHNQRPSSCASHIERKGGLIAIYSFDSALLPYWLTIRTEIIRFTDSVTIQ
ncbi:hypothetical protein ACO0LL_14315 [Undibacterium sp. TC4M20W]|uniref:hypothetical protein n=1 Tax=Undibacterium sp. TC4M20W TaxID=3413052 RepID=UPI003BEF7097